MTARLVGVNDVRGPESDCSVGLWLLLTHKVSSHRIVSVRTIVEPGRLVERFVDLSLDSSAAARRNC
jgi:hypothetical protein